MPVSNTCSILGWMTEAVSPAGAGQDTRNLRRGTGSAELEAIIGDTAPRGHQGFLPLVDALAPLVPGGALRPGSSLHVTGAAGATTVALGIVAGPCRAGGWLGCVGFPQLGWEAATELGLPLGNVVDVELTAPSSSSPSSSFSSGQGDPSGTRGSAAASVLAAMVDAFDIVLCGPAVPLGDAMLGRLRARARERGVVLVGVTPAMGRSSTRWSRCDVELKVRNTRWNGLGQGWGTLSERRITVEVSGRGVLARPRVHELILETPLLSGRGSGPVLRRAGGTPEVADATGGSGPREWLGRAV